MFELERVVPWGRSFDEYQRMFALHDEDLTRRIVGCADGPASFNAEGTRRGGAIVSCDPIYRYTAKQLRERISETHDEVLDQTRRNEGAFVWDSIRDVDELGRVRMAAMDDFLRDYPDGKNEGRYVDAELPRLPFPDHAFDLALCSHFLFLYSNHVDRRFHELAIDEMCRVAAEARIFPLLTLNGTRSPFVDHVVGALDARGTHKATVERVPYEFQRGGNEMLRIRDREEGH